MTLRDPGPNDPPCRCGRPPVIILERGSDRWSWCGRGDGCHQLMLAVESAR